MATQSLQMADFQAISFHKEAGFKALFENTTVATLIANKFREIEAINPIAEKLFGYKRSELRGKLVDVLVPEDLRITHSQQYSDYYANPVAREMAHGDEVFAKKKDGSLFPVLITLCSYHSDGEMYVIAFVTDITELKKTEEKNSAEAKVNERTRELISLLEHEKELNEIKSRFVSIASHEFRTPLSVILSSVNFVESYNKPGLEEKRTKHIERIKNSVKNLTELLNDLLSLEKLEQGKAEAALETFNLRNFCEDMSDEMIVTLKKGQRINLKYEGENEVTQDRKILRNIITNLLSNAIKYSPENKEIFFQVVNKNERVRIDIKDQGIGIPEAEQKNIFSKFYRASNAGNIQGTGLGLNIVKKYAELLEGKISFRSIYNSGSVFTVVFPQKYEPAPGSTAS